MGVLNVLRAAVGRGSLLWQRFDAVFLAMLSLFLVSGSRNFSMRMTRFRHQGGALEQSRGVRRLGVGFGDVGARNARRPSACVSTRGPGSPRIAPGRKRGLPARGTVSAQKASTLTLNAAATPQHLCGGRRSCTSLTGVARGCRLRAGIVPLMYSPSSQNTKLPHNNNLKSLFKDKHP